MSTKSKREEDKLVDMIVDEFDKALRANPGADPEPFVQRVPEHRREEVRGLCNTIKFTKRALRHGLDNVK